MRITLATNIKNEPSTNTILPTTLEQNPIDDLDVLQPSSLPSPPVSNLETVEPKLSLLRPPPFPPPAPSSSSSSSIPCTEVAPRTQTPALFEDLEQLVVNSTRRDDTLLTGAAPVSANNLPRSAATAAATTTIVDAAGVAAIPASQIPNTLTVHLGDDNFTFEANDFVLFNDDDAGPASPPTSPHRLFPTL